MARDGALIEIENGRMLKESDYAVAGNRIFSNFLKMQTREPRPGGAAQL